MFNEETFESLAAQLKPPPITHQVDELTYKVEPVALNGATLPRLGDLVAPPLPHALRTSTLTGLVDFVKSGHPAPDAELLAPSAIWGDPAEVMVVIEDSYTVSVQSVASDKYGRRETYAQAKFTALNKFQFGQFMATEQFLIDLQTSFLAVTGQDGICNLINLQMFVSSVTGGTTFEVADDGFGQRVNVSLDGGSTKSGVALPTRIPLVALRTFREVTAVEGVFMLRFRCPKDQPPQAALFDLDPPSWQLAQIAQIKAYLEKALPGYTVIA